MGIINFSKTVKSKSYLAISLLGSSYKLNIKYVKSSSIDLVQNDSEFCLFLPAKYKNVDNMEIINSAIKKLYDEFYKKEYSFKHTAYEAREGKEILFFSPNLTLPDIPDWDPLNFKLRRRNQGNIIFYKHPPIKNPELFN